MKQPIYLFALLLSLLPALWLLIGGSPAGPSSAPANVEALDRSAAKDRAIEAGARVGPTAESIAASGEVSLVAEPTVALPTSSRASAESGRTIVKARGLIADLVAAERAGPQRIARLQTLRRSINDDDDVVKLENLLRLVELRLSNP